MKRWYMPFLSIFEKDWKEVSDFTKKEIRERIRSYYPENPLVSVVLIAHNEERRIAACLWSLCCNSCSAPVEIFVVDNASSDGTVGILEELGVVHFSELRKGPGFARACGLEHARGKYHLCIDSDTLYPPAYIQAHLEVLQKPDVVCSYSLWSFLPDERHSRRGLFLYESLRDVYLRLQNVKRPELNVRGMVLGFHTDKARLVGFNTNIIRGEDGSMALGLKKYGKLCFITNRRARVMTCNGTLNGGGTLWQNFCSRFKGGLKRFYELFYSKQKYVDRPYNMIDKELKS